MRLVCSALQNSHLYPIVRAKKGCLRVTAFVCSAVESLNGFQHLLNGFPITPGRHDLPTRYVILLFPTSSTDVKV